MGTWMFTRSHLFLCMGFGRQAQISPPQGILIQIYPSVLSPLGHVRHRNRLFFLMIMSRIVSKGTTCTQKRKDSWVGSFSNFLLIRHAQMHYQLTGDNNVILQTTYYFFCSSHVHWKDHFGTWVKNGFRQCPGKDKGWHQQKKSWENEKKESLHDITHPLFRATDVIKKFSVFLYLAVPTVKHVFSLI